MDKDVVCVYTLWNKSEKDKYSVITYMSNLTNKTNECIQQNRKTHRYRKQTSGYQWGDGSGDGQDRGRWLW